jgi:dynein heavy chain
MLLNLRNIIEPLNVAERKLLQSHLTEIKRVMKPGLLRLNWNSLGIPEFIQKCNLEINKVASLMNQIKKNSTNINHIIDSISHAILVKEPPAEDFVDASVGSFSSTFDKKNCKNQK